MKHKELTERHKAVLILRAQGLTNKMVGMELGLSENTIADYCRQVITRIDAHNMDNAIAKASRLGFLDGVEL
jgi:DNA-binding NarL/FixJ family response regulator